MTKKNKIAISFYVVIFGALFILPACNKALDVNSKRMEAEAVAWKSIDDTRSRLIGVYGLFRAALANNNNYWLWGELREGDFVSTSRTDLNAVINSNLNASYPLLEEMRDWRGFYAVINAANLFIERSGNVVGLDPRYTTLNHEIDVAQVKALRAWAYFMMVRIWGNVPLITNSHDGSFDERAQTDSEKVLNFCEAELNAAKDVLPFKYGVAGDPILPGNYYDFGQGRYQNTLISRLAAYALLAHVSAWRGNYNDADIYAKFVIDNRTLSSLDYVTTATLTSPSGIFYERGNFKQLLGYNFVYGHGETGTSGEGHIESWTLAAPLISKPKPDIYVAKTTINEIFTDPADTRFGIDTISGLPKTAYFTNYFSETPVFSKIKVLADGSTNGTFQVYSSAIIFSRLEEITLLRAEALAVLNKETEAITLLNVIRTRRGLPSYQAGDEKDLTDAIFEERRRELLGEGWRWYDLIRYNRIKRNDPAFMTLIQNGGIYWPVSSDALARNSKLVQNTYWQKAQ